MSAGEKVDLQSIIQAVTKDGGPENYKAWAAEYDQHVSSLDWAGPQNIVKKWMEYYSPESVQSLGRKHRILDAGCGTGLIGEYMATVFPMDNIELYGGDITPEMLDLAREKKNSAGYIDLQVINLKTQLPYEEGFFDSVISAGVFLSGHCGPDCLPNVFRVMKKDALLVTTSRVEFFKETKEDWYKNIKESNCELVENSEIPYHTISKGLALIIRKN